MLRRKTKATKRAPNKFPAENSVGYQMRVASRMMQRAHQMLVKPHGISSGTWFFLRVLWDGDGLTQSELAQRVGIMEPTAVIALRAMKKAGLIRRVRNGADKRKVNVYLTAKGKALEKEVVPLMIEVTETALAGFSAAEVRQLLNMLGRIQSNFAADSVKDSELDE